MLNKSLFFIIFLFFSCKAEDPNLLDYPETFEQEFKENFKKFYYISLKQSDDSNLKTENLTDKDKKVFSDSLERQRKMEEDFKPYSFDLIRFPAVFGKTVQYQQKSDFIQNLSLPNDEPITYLGTLIRNKNGTPYYGLGAGELGNFSSHYLAWQEIAKDTNENHLYIISEDDASPIDSFEKKLKSALYHAPEDWELLFLYSNQIPKWGCNSKVLSKTTDQRFLILNKKCTPGTVIYVLKPGTAKRLLENALPFQIPTDERINEEFIVPQTMNIYVTYPELVTTFVDEKSLRDDMDKN